MSAGYILLGISIALICGLASNRLIKLVHLPNVTAYLIVGILLGPYLFSLFTSFDGILTEEMVSSFGIIVDTALGFIAFQIGSEFKISNIKKLGKGILIITIMQSCMAMLFVDIGLSIVTLINGTFKENLPIILTLGAVATATAPAATLMVIKQYKAKGEVTDILLPVVAFDDAVGLILFSLSFSLAEVFAKQNAGISGTFSILNILINPLCEILLSLVIGALIGYILSLSMKWFKSRANRLMCMISAVFLSVALCDLSGEYIGIGMSSLLTCMMVGSLFCNLRDDAPLILEGVDRWTPALFMLFFILSGSELNFKIMGNLIIIGICLVYLLCRSLGKYFGARWGATITKSSQNVKKYLGLTLLPQAGVAIGMARSSSSTFFEYIGTFSNLSSEGSAYLLNIGQTIMAVVLCATLVYELIGPVITKISLTKAGEINIK